MRRNLLVGMGALVCLVLGAAPARAQNQWLVLNQKIAGTAPKVTITQYEISNQGAGAAKYDLQFAVVDNVPLKTMTVKIGGKIVLGPAAGPNPGTFLVNLGDVTKTGLLPAGALVTCYVVDVKGRTAYCAIQLKPWP
jgi:hypothetical protein